MPAIGMRRPNSFVARARSIDSPFSLPISSPRSIATEPLMEPTPPPSSATPRITTPPSSIATRSTEPRALSPSRSTPKVTPVALRVRTSRRAWACAEPPAASSTLADTSGARSGPVAVTTADFNAVRSPSSVSTEMPVKTASVAISKSGGGPRRVPRTEAPSTRALPAVMPRPVATYRASSLPSAMPPRTSRWTLPSTAPPRRVTARSESLCTSAPYRSEPPGNTRTRASSGAPASWACAAITISWPTSTCASIAGTACPRITVSSVPTSRLMTGAPPSSSVTRATPRASILVWGSSSRMVFRSRSRA
jgi:hypothetical protein